MTTRTVFLSNSIRVWGDQSDPYYTVAVDEISGCLLQGLVEYTDFPGITFSVDGKLYANLVEYLYWVGHTEDEAKIIYKRRWDDYQQRLNSN